MDNKTTNIFDLSQRKRQTADEYEAEMAPLREALRKEVQKTKVEAYRGLTIREFARYWEIASGGMHWDWPLEQVACEFDLDSPEDFYEFYLQLPGSHLLDLYYAAVSLKPVCKDFDAPRKETPWVLAMYCHGLVYLTAVFVKRLQDAEVNFFLQDAGDVLRLFNKEVGYRKRSLRRQEKLDKENNEEKK